MKMTNQVNNMSKMFNGIAVSSTVIVDQFGDYGVASVRLINGSFLYQVGRINDGGSFFSLATFSVRKIGMAYNMAAELAAS